MFHHLWMLPRSIGEPLHSSHSDPLLKSFYLELLSMSFVADDLNRQTLKDLQPFLTKRLVITAVAACLSSIALPIAMMSHPVTVAFAVA